MHDVGFTPRRGADPVTEVRERPARVDRGRLAQPAGPRADARRALHDGRGLLRLLCEPAVPAPALRRPECLQRGGSGRRRLRRCADRSAASSFRMPGGCSAVARTRVLFVGDLHCRDPRGDRMDSELHRRARAAGRLGDASSRSTAPLRQAFINGIIPSEQRATVLSFDSFMGSIGGADRAAGPRTCVGRLRLRAGLRRRRPSSRRSGSRS